MRKYGKYGNMGTLLTNHTNYRLRSICEIPEVDTPNCLAVSANDVVLARAPAAA
jgi:hypothetical protein